MTGLKRGWWLLGVSILIAAPASGFAQSSSSTSADGQVQSSPGIAIVNRQSVTPAAASPLQPLADFKDSDVKFNMQALMNTIRDNRHEGWVLAAYPDPKTSRPLIGAGFSLDLPAREHVQRDLLNPNQFLEPSSAQLWQAAGLEPEQLQTMLAQFDRELSEWRKNQFRRKIRTHQLFPEISEEDAMKLLRISTIQAIHNARAYCRDFDQLSGPQQMALTQLVFQMGVNLEEFTQFLYAVNHGPGSLATQPGISAIASSSTSDQSREATTISYASQTSLPPDVFSNLNSLSDAEYWKAVQGTLIHSDWARRYSTRAVSVIAMFDPTYNMAPWEAEAKVRAEVHPLHSRRRRAATVRTASASHKKSNARRTHKS
jgi:hypothetical protein